MLGSARQWWQLIRGTKRIVLHENEFVPITPAQLAQFLEPGIFSRSLHISPELIAGIWQMCRADDQVTSLTGVGPAAAGRQRCRLPSLRLTGAWFLTAQGQSPAAQEALEKLCRTYWRPVYSFIRRQGTGPEEAEDITQSFFALLLQRRNFDDVRKEKGRLRSYLLTSLKHFLVSEHRRAVTLKRGKGQQPVPLDELSGARAERRWNQPITLTAERLYERRWALTLMEQVLRSTKRRIRAQRVMPRYLIR